MLRAAPYDATGAGQFAVASTGNLAWVRGPLVAYSDRVLVSVDRHGQVSRLAAPVKSYGLAVRLGPGGRQLAVSVQSLSRMMVAGFEPGPSPHIGAAQSLFEVGARGLHFGGMPVRCFDVAPDGQRFYVVQTLTPPPTPVVTHRSTSC